MSVPRGKGADISAIAAIESTYGTPPGSGWQQLLLTSFNPGVQDRLGYEPEFGLGHPQDQDPFYEGQRLAPSFGIHWGVRSAGWWLKLMLGAPATTGSNPYTHVFESNLDVPSFSFDEGNVNLPTARYWLLAGAKLAGMQIQLSPRGPAAATFNGFAQARSHGTSAANGSPATFALGKFFNQYCKVQRAGADLGSVIGGQLNYSNNGAPFEEMRGDGKIGGVDEFNRGASGSLQVRRNNSTTLYSDDTGETAVALKVIWTTPIHASYKLEYEFARAFLSIAGAPVEGPAGIDETFNWRAAKPASGNLMKVTLVNDVASYA